MAFKVLNETGKVPDPAYAKLLRNVEHFVQLVMDACEQKKSCTLTFHLQKGAPSGFQIKYDEAPQQ